MTSQQPTIMTSQQSNKLIKIDIKKPANPKIPITAVVVGNDNKTFQFQIMKVHPEPPVNCPSPQPKINSPAPKIARKSLDEVSFKAEESVKTMGQIFVEQEFPTARQEFVDQPLDATPFPNIGLKPSDVPQIFDPHDSIFDFNEQFQGGELHETEYCFPEGVNIDEFLRTPSPKSSATSSVDTSEDSWKNELDHLMEELDPTFSYNRDLLQMANHTNDPIFGLSWLQ